MSRLYGDVPDRPPFHQPRPDLCRGLMVKVLTGARPVGVTAPPASVGVEGMGGIGKTTLVADLCREPEVVAAFPGGLFWLPLGEEPDIVSAQRRLIHWIGGTPVLPRDATEGRDRLDALLTGRRDACLFVLDDLWEIGHVRALLPRLDARHTLLITTRRADLLRTLGAEEHRVDEMAPAEARALLAACAGCAEDRLPDTADAIVRECGRLPLALAIAGAMLRGADLETWAEVLDALRQAEHGTLIEAGLPDYTRARHVFGALAVSTDRLEAEERDRLADLAVFPEDVAVPAAVFAHLWHELPSLRRKRLLSLFADRNLVRRAQDGRVTLHDLQRDYLLRILARDDLAPRHRRLVDGYRKVCGGVWAACPDDGYVFRWLPLHLRGAGETETLRRLLFDPAWMTAKIRAAGVTALEADYALLPDDPEAALVMGAVRLSSYVLSEEPEQLAFQLWGRLAPDQGTAIAALLDSAAESAPRPWLKARRPTLARTGGPLLRTITVHKDHGPLVATLVGPDGRRALSGSHDGTLKLWDLDTGDSLAVLEGHTDGITAVAALPDARRALSGSKDATLRLWDLGSGACLATLDGHADGVTAVAVLPDGKRVLAASAAGTLNLWDLDTGTCLATYEWQGKSISVVAALPDGHCILSGSRDGSLVLWNLTTGTGLAKLEGHPDTVTAAAVIADGRRALTGDKWGILKLWDLDSGACINAFRRHKSAVTALATLPDGRHVLAGSRDQTIELWDLVTGDCLETFEWHKGAVCTVSVLPDGHRVLSGAGDGSLRLWSLAGTRQTLPGEHEGPVRSVAILADGCRAVTGSSDGTVKLWNLDTGSCIATMKGNHGPVHSIALPADADRVVSVTGDRTARLWDLSTGRCLATTEKQCITSSRVTVLPDGRWALIGSTLGTLWQWDFATGTCIPMTDWRVDAVSALAMLPDGRHAVSGSDSGEIILLDLAAGTGLRQLFGRRSQVNALSALPDGKRVLSASWDGTLKLWDLATGACLNTFHASSGSISTIAVLPDGRRALAGGRDWTLSLYDLNSGIRLAQFPLEATILCCAVAGTVVVAGDTAGRLHVFDLIDSPDPAP